MKLSNKKLIILALAIALLPTTVQAQTVTIQDSQTPAQIAAAIHTELSSNSIVIVNGEKTNASVMMMLNIPDGKTVKWQADYSGSSGLIQLSSGYGTFELTGGAVTTTGEFSNAITNTGSPGGTLKVSGGTVTAERFAIYANTGNVEITGGVLQSKYVGIWANLGVNVTVSGSAEVTASYNASGSYGIYCNNNTSGSVTVSGGTVTGESYGILASKSNVTVSGTGKVVGIASNSCAIRSEKDITISDNAVVTSNYIGIYNDGDDGNVTVNGGTVMARYAIYASGSSAEVRINGGTIAGYEEGIEVETGTVVIDGGSITSVYAPAQPKNSDNADVYLNTLTIGGAPQKNAPVTAASVNSAPCNDTPDAASGVYGIKSVVTDNAGNVYFWLPVSGNSGTDAEEVTVTAGSVYKNKYRRGTSEVEKTLRQNYVAWSAVAADGADGVANTTGITLTFSPAVTGLTENDITIDNVVGNVTKGILTDTHGNGTEYNLAVTTNTQGNIIVSVPDKDETAFGPDETVTFQVYLDAPTVDVTDKQNGIIMAGDTTNMPVGGQFVFTFPEKMDTTTARTITLSNSWDGTTAELTGYFLNDSVTFVVDYRRLDFRTAYTLALSGFYDKAKLYIYEETFAFVTQDYPPAPAIARYITLPAVSGVVMQPAAGSHRIQSGSDFVFTLTPPAGMVPYVTTDRLLGGSPETLKGTQNADGSYTFVIRDVRENITVSITFATGNEAVGATSLKVWPNPVPRGGTARLEYGAPDNTEVRIYTVQGTLVSVQKLQNGQATLTFPPVAGVYVVRVGSATAKAIVN